MWFFKLHLEVSVSNYSNLSNCFYIYLKFLIFFLLTEYFYWEQTKYKINIKLLFSLYTMNCSLLYLLAVRITNRPKLLQFILRLKVKFYINIIEIKYFRCMLFRTPSILSCSKTWWLHFIKMYTWKIVYFIILKVVIRLRI